MEGYHSSKWYKNHPKAVRPNKKKPAKDPKDHFPLGDSVTILALLVGVLLVLVVPPLYAKVPLFVAVCAGFVWLVHKSHWTHGLSILNKILTAVILIAVLCGVSLPQFYGQWKAEHSTEVQLSNPKLVESDADRLPNVDLSKRPLIAGAFGDLASCRPANGPVNNLYMMVSFVNKGIPTALSGWNLHLEVAGVKQDFIYQRIGQVERCTGYHGTVWTFKGKDAIYEKAERLIPTGEIVRGWVKFTIPGELYPQVPEHAKMVMTFSDFQFNQYSMTFRPTSDNTQIMHFYPGIDDPRHP